MSMEERNTLHTIRAGSVSASVDATAQKRSLGRVLRAADAGPIAVTRNGRIEAYLVSVRWLEGGPRTPAERAHAGATQALLEARAVEARRDEQRRERLSRQLRAKDPKARLAAKTRLDQWERDGMLDQRVIREWREILALPRGQGAMRACADSAPARQLRKSSPFIGLTA